MLLVGKALNGSGVGRAYDDDMCVVDWDYMPIVRCVLDESHADFEWGMDESVKDARHKYDKVYWFEVPDSREGWAQAIEKMETMALVEINGIGSWDMISLTYLPRMI